MLYIIKLILSTSLLFAETFTGFDSFVGSYDVQKTVCSFVIFGEPSDECPKDIVITQIQILKDTNGNDETIITIIEKMKDTQQVLTLKQDLSDLSNPQYFTPSTTSSLWMNWRVQPLKTDWKIIYVGPGKTEGLVEFYREYNTMRPGMPEPHSGKVTYSLKPAKK